MTNSASTYTCSNSKNQPGEAISALRSQLARGKPDAVISAMSSVSNAIKPVVEQEHVLTAATTTALKDLLDGSTQIFRVYPTSQNFVEPVADYVLGKAGKVAMLYVHDDFGASNYAVFKSLLHARGIALVASEPYELIQPETRTLVSKIVAARPEIVYLVGYGPTYTRLFKEFKELAPHIEIVADISLANPAVLTALGSDADGLVFNGTDAELSEPSTAAAAAFRKRYVERFQQEPFMVAGFAYDATMMLARAAYRGGHFKVPTREDVQALSPHSGIMGRISLDRRGESDIPLSLMTRTDGRTVPFPTKP